MKRTPERIRIPLLIPIAVALMLVLGTTILFNYWFEGDHIEEEFLETVKGIQKLYKTDMNEEAVLLSSLMDLVEEDRDLKRAWSEKDRDALFELSTPIFERLRSWYHVTHFYFIDPDKQCYLRVHNRDRHGDRIDRFTLDQAARKGRSAWGVELGPFGTFTIRYVRPWRIDGELVGYLELGEDIAHLSRHMKSVLAVDLLFLIEKRFLDRSRWEEGMRMIGREGNWEELPKQVVIENTVKKDSRIDTSALRELVGVVEGSIRRVKMDGRTYYSGNIPFFDAGEGRVGHIIVLRDATDRLYTLHLMNAMLLAVGFVVGGSLFLFFIVFVGRIEKNLVHARNELKSEITERKHAENRIRASKDFLDNVLESLDNPFMVIDPKDYSVILANSAAEKSYGEGKRTCHSMTHGRDKPCEGPGHICPVNDVKKSGKPTWVEHVHSTADGSTRIFEIHAYPVFGEDGEVAQVLEFSIDITERKEMEELIRGSLKEKQLLLEEIHHRVKNNMQVIYGLLDIQSGYITDERSLGIFKACQNRIMSMALIHEQLYKSKDLANIHMGEYIQSLVRRLSRSYNGVFSDVEWKIDVDEVSLGINTAISCGLIVNEIVTNSINHAFPEGRKGEIRITLHTTGEDEFELIMGDNGVGIPEGIDFRKAETFGFKMLLAFGEDELGGRFELDRSVGTEFRIKFKIGGGVL